MQMVPTHCVLVMLTSELGFEHKYTHTGTHTPIHTYTYTGIHIHTHAYTRVHAYIHTHMHTHTFPFFQSESCSLKSSVG